VTVDVPSGRLACVARCDVVSRREVASRRVLGVRFRNVPSFVLAEAVTVATSAGPVRSTWPTAGVLRERGRAVLGLSVDTRASPSDRLQRELRPASTRRSTSRTRAAELHGIYGYLLAGRADGTGTGPALTSGT